MFRKAWQKIVIAGAGSGLIASVSILAGIPLDKEELSHLFIKSACLSWSGSYQQSCLAWAVLISLAASIVGLIFLLWNIRKVRRFWRVPGWIMGVIFYIVSYIAVQAAVFRYLG